MHTLKPAATEPRNATLNLRQIELSLRGFVSEWLDDNFRYRSNAPALSRISGAQLQAVGDDARMWQKFILYRSIGGIELRLLIPKRSISVWNRSFRFAAT